ncbi:hypothetical protein D1818_08985 [Aquimarina sp. BL5]|uniref:hypothetical protein n=1 Tax=Aquimarina sp. BL5 TaxID=1714860 RepID=UPI000E48A689|nr:hypothetical protein [Aquimarina sp. BL5]AXT50952.1 hypothetical protein D1818_08985 [Aquimarina sp. BL5]RKN03538.1 hypothetical protein D7036_13590 [Aquimarina sp. BL5]
MKNIILLSIFSLFMIACKQEAKKEYKYEDDIEIKTTETTKNKILTTAESIANANGFEHWKNVNEIKFTFNVDRDSSHYERSWSWKPQKNEITLTTAKDTISYNRAQIDSTSLKADQGFINDKYWLLAPFNLVWDQDSFTSEHQVKAVAPISNKEMQKFTIVYKNEGGYTPGDAYDFYFEGDFKIKEWVFREKNKEEASLITSWEDYENFNGIKIAKTHNKNEGDWKLYFTNIEVLLN